MLLLVFTGSVSGAQDGLDHELTSGQVLELNRFQGTGKTLLLWLPSERGIGKAHEPHAAALANMGHEVWLANLHDSYFIERNRSSISKFPIDDVVDLIDAATRASDAGVVLLSSSRGAQLVLIAAREWQRRNPGKTGVRGTILIHAHLYQARPEVGEKASYLPIAAATNLPVYLLDSQYGTKSARIGELAEMLGSGGSQVFFEVVAGVQGGYFMRDDKDLSEVERVAKENHPLTLGRAIKALTRISTPTAAVATSTDTRQFSRPPQHTSALTSIARPMSAPPLQLSDFLRRDYSLDAYAGQVVLVNFWASWCKPCVKEIPSLHRLQQSILDPGFTIVTVNVGESRERVENFLKRVPMELPILLDLDSQAAKLWNIYVYPSSYLVDQQGKIRYAYLGALEWDTPDNIRIIQNLLSQR